METDLKYYFNDMGSFPLEEIFIGAAYPWDIIANAKAWLKENIEGRGVTENNASVLGASHFYGNYYIGAGTEIYNGVTVIGPAYIGKNVEIMPGALIRPYTIIGDGCSVGHCSEIKASVMQNKSKVASLAFVGDSLLGKSARVGSGAVLANRRFDQGVMSVGGVDTGLSFLGCVIGDNARIGANSVTQPGTFIGAYTWILPATNVWGFIPAEKRVGHPKELKITDNARVELS